MDRQDAFTAKTHLFKAVYSSFFITKFPIQITAGMSRRDLRVRVLNRKCPVRILTGNRLSILPEKRMAPKWGGCFEYLAVHDTLGSPSFGGRIEWKTRRNRAFHFKTFQKGKSLCVCVWERESESSAAANRLTLCNLIKQADANMLPLRCQPLKLLLCRVFCDSGRRVSRDQPRGRQQTHCWWWW